MYLFILKLTLGTSISLILPSVLQISESVLNLDNELMKAEIYTNRLIPIIAILLKCPDRSTR